MDLARLLGEMSGPAPTPAETAKRRKEIADAVRPRTDRVARVMHLLEVLGRARLNKWAVGDFVTTTADSGLNPGYVGEPHVIIAVKTEAQIAAEEDANDAASTIRILTIDRDGDVNTAWVEPWRLETYTGPMPEARG